MVFINIQAFIYSENEVFDISQNIIENINITTYYKETPSNIQFKFINTNFINVEEGNSIFLKIDDKNLFFGYIFTIDIEENNIFTIKAYDQLRYLITRDTYIYSNKTANQIISMICDDFSLKKGDIENTNYIIPSRIEENQTILNIIYTSLELTKNTTSNQFIFFDDFGKICLKNYENMKLDFIIDLQNVYYYKMQKSIDNDVYNCVKVSVKNKKTKIISIYKKEDEVNKNKWGTLTYFERLPNTYTKPQAENYALNLLNLKNKPYFNIYLETEGNLNVRAGNILTILNENYEKQMIVKKCIHSLNDSFHIMKLTLAQV